jgi:hypothetical protein
METTTMQVSIKSRAGRRSARQLVLATMTVAVMVILSADPAAAIVPSSAWNHWSSPVQLQNFEQRVTPMNDPGGRGAWFFPTFFQFEDVGMGSNGGYIGLQSDIYGKRVMFSVWGATGAESSGLRCDDGPFEEDGPGYQAFCNYDWRPGRTYRISLAPTTGSRWEGRICGVSSATPAGGCLLIGRIRVPDTWGGTIDGHDMHNFTEWYGNDLGDCSNYPGINVRFEHPTGYDSYDQFVTLGYNGYDTGAGNCSPTVTYDGSAVQHYNP